MEKSMPFFLQLNSVTEHSNLSVCGAFLCRAGRQHGDEESG